MDCSTYITEKRREGYSLPVIWKTILKDKRLQEGCNPKEIKSWKDLFNYQADAEDTFAVSSPLIDLNGLTHIDEETAKELSKFKGNFLYLNGLTHLDKGTAKELSKFKGNFIYLNGLTSSAELSNSLFKWINSY
jgi:hypothetical protein